MGRKGRLLRRLAIELARVHPEIDAPEEAIAAGRVLVDGRIVRNPASLVRLGSSIALRGEKRLRGEPKLRAALTAFGVPVSGRFALDLGAAAGGFTRVLLEEGAARVFAVDAGYGQLLGSLRQDDRVVNLERTNVGELTKALVPDVVELITIDLSYLPVATAAGQLEALEISPTADLIALVKPAFELCLAELPTDQSSFDSALEHARQGLERHRWVVAGSIRSPVTGAGGAIEFLLHARRDPGAG